MEIEIACQGNLNEFGDIKSRLVDYEGIESVEVRGISKFSVDSMSSTIITLSVLSIGVQLAKFIYDVVQDRKRTDKTVNVKVNQQIVNINSTDSIEQIQLNLNINKE